MKLVYKIYLVLILAVAAGCGGGGGNPGTVAGGSTSATTATTGSTATTATTSVVAPAPTILVSIIDVSGNTVTSNSISGGATFYAKALVKNADGSPVTNKLVTFSTDAGVASLSSTTVLTDPVTGIARAQITPVSLTSQAAANLVASASVSDVAISGSVDYQTSAANVSLASLTVAQPNISALQTTAVSVQGLINGALASSGQVTATFSASCGSFSPASAVTNGSGLISTTYQSAVACSGPISITSQAPGATAVTSTVNVTAAQPANIVFSSATVPLMVTSAAPSGAKQSTIRFQVLNNAGSGMAGQNITLSLASQAISAGVTFSIGGLPSVAAQVVPTDSSGFVSITVSSGALPTPVIISGALVSNPLVTASSSGVAVTSGVPSQDKSSLSVDKFSLEALAIDGVQATLTIRVSDRLSNPIQAGTIVNFIASHGLIQGTCAIDANSQCSVKYTSQGIRPPNGRVAILAYMDGEESFVDQNGDNIWQVGEPFNDVGRLFMDSNESGVYDVATEQFIPGGLTGGVACSGVAFSYPSIANTCDGTWSSSVRIRRQVIVVLASSNAVMTLAVARTLDSFTVNIADVNGNSMPTGTTISAAVTKNDPAPVVACAVTNISPNNILNTTNSGNHQILLNGENGCLTARIEVSVTTPGGLKTTFRF